ncbi:hypothetical protein PGS49_11085, partial [Yersinia intermedia]|uniref:hypothetical protein n=1 Tax=Yersinia intermedia TaxID=631 RepID=UPI0022FEAABF
KQLNLTKLKQISSKNKTYREFLTQFYLAYFLYSTPWCYLSFMDFIFSITNIYCGLMIYWANVMHHRYVGLV